MPKAVIIDKQKVSEVANRWGICYLALFGSVARGESTAESDVDLAVRFANPVTLFDYIDVQLEMEAVLGHPIDLIPIDSVYDFVRESMSNNLILLYESSQDAAVEHES